MRSLLPAQAITSFRQAGARPCRAGVATVGRGIAVPDRREQARDRSSPFRCGGD